MITEEQLEDWERLVSDVPPGPWVIDRDTVHGPAVDAFDGTRICDGCECPGFIVSAREAMPALIAEVRRLRALICEPQIIVERAVPIDDMAPVIGPYLAPRGDMRAYTTKPYR